MAKWSDRATGDLMSLKGRVPESELGNAQRDINGWADTVTAKASREFTAGNVRITARAEAKEVIALDYA
jgi:hypothetical protein